MADALQLLQLANQQTANLYDRIDRNLQESLNLQLQTSNNQANLALKGLEFAEQARMNDARIKETEVVNGIRAQQVELQKRKMDQEASLFPIQIETERFKLENEKTRTELLHRQAQNTLFGDAISPIQGKFASSFATIQDPEMAREYSEVITRAKTEIAAGNNINLEDINSRVNGIIDRYKDSPFKSDQYNPEVANYLQMFAPSEAKRYETRNPTIQKNRALLGGSMLTASDAAFAQMAEQNGHMFTPQETSVLSTGRTIIGQLESENDKLIQQAANLDMLALKSRELDPEKKSLYETQREMVTKKLENNRNKIIAISTNISSGNFSLEDSSEKIPAATPPPSTTEIESRLESASPSASLGLPNQLLESSKDENRATRINQYVKTLKDATGRADSNEFPDELLGLDFSYTLQTRNNDVPNFQTLAKIKDTIEENLRTSYSDKGKKREFNKRYGENAIDSILKNVKVSQDVPLSEFAMDRLYGLRSFEVDPKTEVRGISIGSKGGNISSYKDLQRLLDNIEDKDEREEIQRELTAAIITLGLGSSVQD